MSVKIVQDEFYQKNQEGEEVFTLITSKEGGISYSRSYTFAELEDIMDKIRQFLRMHGRIV